MMTIFIKELKGFFSSLQGYLITALFLLTSALFLWVIPGSWNIPASGYASLQGLFELAPWLFLFFIPAVTMKVFSDEIHSGSIELLYTRPVNKYRIVLSKYLAVVVLLLIAILPTLIWVISLSYMAEPVGNIDSGAIAGSYIALFLLGTTYGAIGIFGSSLTGNQVVAFLISLAICFLMYSGFELLGSAPGINAFTGYMVQFGIDSHYQSISRGVLDSRDLIYFCSVIIFFLSATTVSISHKK